MSEPKQKAGKKKWRPPQKPATDKQTLERKTKNDYKKLLRKSEFKNFKSEVVNQQQQRKQQQKQQLQQPSQKQQQQQQRLQQQQPGERPAKQNAFTKAERDRKKAASQAAEAKAKSEADAESRRKAMAEYGEKKKKNFKHLSRKTNKGQPHMGSQMEVLLQKIQKQMQS